MAVARAETLQRHSGLLPDHPWRGQQYRGVKVTLYRHAVTDPGPGLGQRNGPVDAQCVAAGVRDRLEATVNPEFVARYGLEDDLADYRARVSAIAAR